MKKLSRILSVLLAVVLAFGVLPFGQLTAAAADAPKLSLNVVSETDKEVVVSINLESGSFTAVDLGLKVNSKNFTCTTAIQSDEVFAFEKEIKKNGQALVAAALADTLLCSMSTTTPFSKAQPIFVFTFAKATATRLTKKDISLFSKNFCDGNGKIVSPTLVNNVRENADFLPAPTVKGSNVASTGKIKLTWDAVNGAVKYNIYRASTKSGTYKYIWSTDKTSFINSSPTAGQTRYYKVCAVEADGSEGEMSAIVTRTCDCAKPVIKTATNVASSGKIKLTWDKVNGATAYKVYRATSEKGTYKLMKTTTNLSYTNTSATPGTKYFYKIKAVGTKSAADSAYSAVVSCTCDLDRPVIKVSLNSKGNPKVSWGKVDGAVAYEVYRSTSENGSYKLLKTTTSTSFTNTSFKAKTTYYYKVIAVSSNTDANSAYSTVKSVTTK